MSQKMICAAAFAVLIFCAGAVAAVRAGMTGVPSVFVAGRLVRTAAILDRGHLLVPVRGIFESFGAAVTYTPPRIVVVRKDGVVIAGLVVDRRHAVVGNRPRMLVEAPIRRNGRIYVPLRVIAELVGATVSYSSRPRLIDIRVPGDRLMAPPEPAATSAVAAEDTTAPVWAMVLVGLLVVAFTLECVRRLAIALLGSRRQLAPHGGKIANAAPAGDHHGIGEVAK